MQVSKWKSCSKKSLKNWKKNLSPFQKRSLPQSEVVLNWAKLTLLSKSNINLVYILQKMCVFFCLDCVNFKIKLKSQKKVLETLTWRPEKELISDVCGQTKKIKKKSSHYGRSSLDKYQITPGARQTLVFKFVDAKFMKWRVNFVWIFCSQARYVR